MDSSETINQYLYAYTPRLLSSQEWALAATPVRRLVAASGPRRVSDARVLGASLCRFLSESTAWDRQSPPDLAALLTEQGIAAFAVAFTGAVQSRVNYVSALRALGRTAHGVERPIAVERTAPVPASVARIAAAAQRCSVSTLAAVHHAHLGRPLTEDTLRVLITQIIKPTATATAPAGVPGMLARDPRASLATLDAPDTLPATEAVPATKPPKTTPRPVSHRQQLKHARAAKAVAQALAQGPTLAPFPDVEDLDPEVSLAVQNYRPQGTHPDVWAELRPLTIHLLAASQPASVVSARNAATIIVRFLTWLRVDPYRSAAGTLSAQELIGTTALTRYLALPPGHPSTYSAVGSRITANSVLRRAVAAIEARPSTSLERRGPVAPPFTPDECEQLIDLARFQNTVTKERNLSYLVGLGLGAGLASCDLRVVRKLDIEEVSDPVNGTYLTVQVRSGVCCTNW